MNKLAINFNQHQPLVSVCIALYNHERFLRQTLDSVLAQTYKNFEIIVVDDGSSDGSLELLESYARQYPSIRVFTHPNKSNKGISATTNLAVEQSRGEYLAFLGSDDVWCEDKLERQLPLFDDSQIGLVCSRSYIIDGVGQRVPDVIIGTDVSNDPDVLVKMIRANQIAALTVVVRRECFEQLGLFDAAVYSDWEMWMRIMARWKVGFIDEPLAFYRVHDYNTSIGIKPEVHLQYSTAAILALYHKAAEIGGPLDTPRMRALLNLQAAYFFYYLSEETKAAEYLRAAFGIDPALRNDSTGFGQWLGEQIYNGLQPLPSGKTAQDFSSWLLANLQSVAGKQFSRRVAKWHKAHVAARVALSCHETNVQKARRKMLECFINDPSRFKDEELRWVFAKTLIGSGAITHIGDFKRRLRGHA